MKGMHRGKRVKQSTGSGRRRSGAEINSSRKAGADKDPSNGQRRYVNHTIAPTGPSKGKK